MLQTELPRLLDLPQDAVGAIRGGGVGFIEGVNRRKTGGEHIQNRDHSERTGLIAQRRLAEFNHARIHATLQQKLGVLINAVLIHAAASMATILVAQIQLVMLGQKGQFQHARFQAAMRLERAALAARGLEGVDVHAQRNAGLAAIAIGPVGEHAAAAKARSHQLGIGFVMNQMAGRGNLAARDFARHIAARIRRCRVELQRLEREFFEQGHAEVGSGCGLTAGLSEDAKSAQRASNSFHSMEFALQSSGG